MNASVLLSRAPHRSGPALSLFDGAALQLARVHEICGRARRTLAAVIAGKTGGPILWIAPEWGADPLNPDGLCAFAPPQDMLFATPRRAGELLWVMEEALRAGCVPLVVADLPEPPPLTPVRRLHLAAEAGAGEGRVLPLGLILTPGAGGAPGVETRWQIEPEHTPEEDCWSLWRRRARMAPEKRWTVGRDDRGGLREAAQMPRHPAPEG